MNLRELSVLEALNIVSTIYSVYDPDPVLRPLSPTIYRATASQIARYLAEEYPGRPPLTARQIGATLSSLSGGRDSRRPRALVERFNSKHWRLTPAGVSVLAA